MSTIYRSAEGEAIVREWCENRLAAWAAPHERVVLDGPLGPTHVTVAGSGSPAVVWLPGTNFNAATSGALAAHVARSRRVYVVDLPGQPGLSSPTRLGRDRMQRYGAWLGDVVARLDEPVVVAGHSLGAAIALAASPSDSILGIALIGPAGLRGVRVTPRLLAVSTPWMLRPSPDRAGALLSYMQHPSSAVDGDLAEWLDLVARHTRPVGAPGPLPRTDLERWRGAATVVVGEADAFFPPSRLREIAEESLQTGIRVVEGAGHLVPDEQPERLATLLEEFAAGS